MPAIPALWEAKVRGSLESRSSSSLGNKSRPPSLQRIEKLGWAWWLMPVIQALWRPRPADHLRLGVQDQPDQHGETPSLKKKNRKISQVWWHVPVVPATWGLRWEDHLGPRSWGCSELWSHHHTPAWATEQDSVLKIKKNNRPGAAAHACNPNTLGG